MRQSGNIIKNQIPYILDDPKGIDIIAKDLQLHFDNSLTWLEKSFNRATSMISFDNNGDDNIKPVCWVNDGKDKLNMLDNDNWSSYFFSHSNEDENTDNWVMGIDDNKFTSTLSLYFWFDLSKVNSTKTYDYLNELNEEIKLSLNEVVYSVNCGAELVKVVSNQLNIYDAFNKRSKDLKKLTYPYKALRYDLNVFYPLSSECIS